MELLAALSSLRVPRPPFFFFLTGSGWALTFTPTLACLSRYFSRRRSLATGLALTGVGLSSFAFAPLFQWLLSQYAWRGALLLVSALSLHLVACGALLRPLFLTEDPAIGGVGAQLVSLLHHSPFLCYAVALTLINTGYFIPYVHLVAHLQDLGWDPLPAAFLLSVVAISDLVGRVASGWLGDVVPGPVARLLMLWTTLSGVALILFPVAQAPTALVALAVAYGFTTGALTPVAFSVLPELVGTGRIYCGLGLLQMVESIGGLLGAPLSGKENGISRWARAAIQWWRGDSSHNSIYEHGSLAWYSTLYLHSPKAGPYSKERLREARWNPWQGTYSLGFQRTWLDLASQIKHASV